MRLVFRTVLGCVALASAFGVAHAGGLGASVGGVSAGVSAGRGGIGVGVSAGGVSAGASVSAGGVSAGASASAGSVGAAAGASAGTSGVSAGASASVGNASAGAGVGVGGVGAGVGVGSGGQATPGTAGRTASPAAAAIANMSQGEVVNTRKRCLYIMSSRNDTDRDLKALCQLLRTASR